MKFVEYTLPSHWASALINGDHSGMEEAEEAELLAFIKAERPGYCVGCGDEEFFSACHDAMEFALPSDCLVFTFQVVEAKE